MQPCSNTWDGIQSTVVHFSIYIERVHIYIHRCIYIPPQLYIPKILYIPHVFKLLNFQFLNSHFPGSQFPILKSTYQLNFSFLCSQFSIIKLINVANFPIPLFSISPFSISQFPNSHFQLLKLCKLSCHTYLQFAQFSSSNVRHPCQGVWRSIFNEHILIRYSQVHL